MFFQLIALHCLADYSLQNDFVAKAKNPSAPLPGVPWWLILAVHSAIHAGTVSLVAPPWCVATEFVSHFVIDYGKCKGWFGSGQKAFIIDQGLHVGFKAVYVLGSM